jgi:curved DNA-binding protein CbpA
LRNHYATLGIKDFASIHQIKKAYRKIAFSTHPDRTGADEKLKEVFLAAQEAYLFLSDERKRATLDNYLRSQEDTVNKKTTQSDGGSQKEGSFTQRREKQKWNFKTKFDRSKQTEPRRPEFGCAGERVDSNSVYFWYPRNIGTILFGHSDLYAGFKLPTQKEIFRRASIYVLISLVFWGVTLLFSPNQFWEVVWLILPLAITGYAISGSNKEVFNCVFVGVNGFALASKTYSRQGEGLSDEVDVSFDSIDIVFFFQKDCKISWQYDHSEILFVCYDDGLKLVHHYFEEYNKDVFATPYNLSFYHKVEEYWTAYCLDTLEQKLESEGRISFMQFDPELKYITDVISLSRVNIKFQNGESYDLDEIGKVYTKGSKLYFESKGYNRSFFQSDGTRDHLDLSLIGNRRFFVATLEILTGYKI